MKTRKLSFFLLLLISSLHVTDEEIPGRLSANQQPQAVVAACVNTVSGSFFFSETDLPAAGLGTLQLVRSYDKNGNPLSKKTYGQITGNQDNTVALTKQIPNEDQPFQETTFEYSEDGQIKPNGTEIHYTYLPGTSLVQSKRTVSQGICRLREFYTYNSAGFKTEIIEDDGSGSDVEDLSDVAYRIKTVNTYDKKGTKKWKMKFHTKS